MQDGSFHIPDVLVPTQDFSKTGIGTGPALGGQTSPEYTPIEYRVDMPTRAFSAGPLYTNPQLYDDIKIANQSGFTNWWNTLKNSWNETQIGVGASDLMDGLKKKAILQGELAQLQTDFTLGRVPEMEYLQKTNELYDKIRGAYNTIAKARESMYEDETDKGPISKAFQFKSNIANLQGGDASFIDQFKYQLPTVLGSSLSLMGQGVMAAFGQKAITAIVARTAAGAGAGGPWGAALGLVAGVGSTLAVNLVTRNLESKAEVGGQFLQDYEMLKSDFLSKQPDGHELTEEEDNKIILQASEGADQQYNKNMTLALSDTLQSLIFAGSFNKMLSKFSNLNKFTRLATQAAGFYTAKKLEGLEEGLQYAWSTEKTLASLGAKDSRNFFASLADDYDQVIGSMNFFGANGGGIYAKDKQFQASVESGELLGGLFGGVHTAVSIGKDIQAYRSTTKELSAMNPEKVNSPVFAFKNELYAKFFGPKRTSVIGLFDQDADNRVFYFKEALKTLSKQRTEDGKPLLEKEELKTELANIDQAYSTFKEVNETLDSIMSPWGKEASNKSKLAKLLFRNRLFNNTMELQRLEPKVRNHESQVMTALANMSDVSAITAKLGIINERLINATGTAATHLNAQKKDLESQLESVKETYTALNEKPPAPQPIDQATAKLINDYYDASETKYNYTEERKDLSKVKSWKQLTTWFKGYEKTAPAAEMRRVEEAYIADNKKFAEQVGVRQPYAALNDEEKKARNIQNKDILNRSTFDDSYIKTLTEEELDKQAEAALKELKEGVLKVSEDAILDLINRSPNKDALEAALSRPSVRAAFTNLGYKIADDFDTIKAIAEDRERKLLEERKNSKVRRARPAGLETNKLLTRVSGRAKDAKDTRETEDYERIFNITNGQAKQSDVLKAIIDSQWATEAEKAQARQMLAITTNEVIIFRENWRSTGKNKVEMDANGRPVSGDYTGLVRAPGSTAVDYKTGVTEVRIDLGYFGDEFEGNQTVVENDQYKAIGLSFEGNILHELWHRYTLKAIKENVSIAENTQLATTLEAILEKVKAKAKEEGGQYYGLLNVREMVAEAWVSPEFQALLARTEGILNTDVRASLWSNLMTALSNFLKDVFGLEISNSALEDVMALTSGFIQGGTKKVNNVALVEAMRVNITAEYAKIEPGSKTSTAQAMAAYSKMLDAIMKTVVENELPDNVKQEMVAHLDAASAAMSEAIKIAREKNNKLEFKGKTFQRGTWAVIDGYDKPYWISGVNERALLVKSKDGKTQMEIENLEDIVFNGDEAAADYFIATYKDEDDGTIVDNGDMYKSVVQEFEKDSTGKYKEATDPIEIRFNRFVAFMHGKNLAKSGYRLLLVQDDDAIAGFAIPRSAESVEAIKSKGAGQVVVVVDKDGNPVKFDSNFNPSESGEYVVFNIETPTRIRMKSLKALADKRGITIAEAKELRAKVARNVENARQSAKEGKPVFLDITGVNPGVNSGTAASEATVNSISSEDAARVVRVVNYIANPGNTNKGERQRAKDFLFFYITPKQGKNAKVSGGEIEIEGKKVKSPTEQQILDNFDYMKSTKLTGPNAPYDVLDVKDGQLVTEKTYPSYADYINTISNVSGPITRSRYNGYLMYEIKEVKKPAPSEKTIADKKADIERRRQEELALKGQTREEKGGWIKPSQRTGKGIENVSILGEKHNDGNKVIIANAMPTADGYETGDYEVYVIQHTPQQFTDGVLSKAPDVTTMFFKDKAEADRYMSDKNESIEKQREKRIADINAKYDAELAALEPGTTTPASKPDDIKPADKNPYDGSLFNSSIDDTDEAYSSIGKDYNNDLGLFDNTTTFELVKSLDLGIHAYLRTTAVSSIVAAMEDPDFINKALEQTRGHLITRVEAYRDVRREQLEAGKISEAYYKAKLDEIQDKVDKLNNNWAQIVTYYKANSYVFSFGKEFAFKYDENGNVLRSDDDTSIAREKGFDRIGNEVSPIDGASKEIKALIKGLPRYKMEKGKVVKVIENGKEVSLKIRNSFNVPDLTNFAVTWNNMLKNLQGLMSTEEMMEKMETLKDRFPEYEELLQILRGYMVKARAGETDAIIMLTKFHRDFSNPEIPVIQNLINLENGTVFKVDEATRKNVKDLRKEASNNFRYKSKFRGRNKQANIVLNPKITLIQTVTREERVAFLRGLGFELSESTIADPAFDTVASQQVIKYIKEEINSIVAAGQFITDPIADLSRQTTYNSGQTKRINDILDLESKYTVTAPTLSMVNSDGNTEYAISRPNGYSVIIKALNHIFTDDLDEAGIPKRDKDGKKIVRYTTFQDLIAEPHLSFLDKSYARTSALLNTMFVLDSKKNYGKRRMIDGKPITLKFINVSGLEVENGEGHKTTSMFIGDKIVSDFNQFLKSGSKEFMRAGDKNSSFGAQLSNWIQPDGSKGRLPISNFNVFSDSVWNPELEKIMGTYLKGEVARMILGAQENLSNISKVGKDKKSYPALVKQTSLFKMLIPEKSSKTLLEEVSALPKMEPNSDELYAAAEKIANDYITKAEVKNTMKQFFNAEVNAKLKALARYGFSFNDNFWLDDTLKKFTREQLLRSYIVNEFILHVEQTKLFNGDIVFYSNKDGEAHKRFPSMGATGIIPSTDKWFVEAMNNHPLTNLQAKKLGINSSYSNVVKTVVLADNFRSSVYIDNWTAQLKAQGLSDEKIKAIVTPYAENKEADAQGWITMDYYRSFKISIGDWRLSQERIYEKISNGDVLNAADVEQFSQIFPPIKAQYSGPVHNTAYHVPAFHKFSLLPLLPSAIKGTSLESLNERMIRNNVGYALVESGSKVGTIGGNLENFYDARNSTTMKDPTTPFVNENLIYTHFLKEQVQIEPELHNEVIFGTQFRKLLFSNIYSSGEATNETLAALERQYSDVIAEITEFEKKSLIQSMGVEPVMKDGDVVDYKVKDESKLIDRIKEEINRRKLNNSIKDFFQTVDGKLKYNLDASINHQQIRNLVMSMINNKLIRQTIKGDMAVQASGLGFERLQTGTDLNVLENGSNGLRFYHIANGKIRKMQVKVALTGDFKNLLNLNWKGAKIGTLANLNAALKDKEWAEEHNKQITMIGYRIPTQGLNSMEVMEVAEFLPAEAGSVLVVPTEIVTKTGSDFDIDKLNIFKPSLSKNGSYIERGEFKGTFADIKESIDPELEELKAQRKTYEFFDKLSPDRKLEFIQEIQQDLPSANASQLAEIGITIRGLREKIQDVQETIDNINAELESGFRPEKYEQLIAARTAQGILMAEALGEIERKEALRRSIIGQTTQDFSKIEALLEKLYDKLLGEDKVFNDSISARIKELTDTRREQLTAMRNYKNGLYNTIIELAAARLTDASSFEQLITPNSPDLVKGKVKEIADKSADSKKSYLHTNNFTSSTQEEKFLAGIPNKKALGIAAVANVMSQLFNKVGVRLSPKFNGRTVFHPMISDRDFSGALLDGGVLKSEIESQMINAYVDVLNDDFISRANLSLDTAGAFFYLLHLGHSSDQLLDFFNHPVIKTYVAELQKNKSIITKYRNLLDARGENLERAQRGEDTIQDLDQYLSNKAKRAAVVATLGQNIKGVPEFRNETRSKVQKAKDVFTKEKLQEKAGSDLSSISQEEKELVLAYYLDVLEESSELLKLQLSNNYDTATSVNPVSHELREAIKDELLEKGLFNTIDITSGTVIKPFNQFSLIGRILDALMPVTLNGEVRKGIVELVKDLKGVDQDLITRTFINDWLQYIAFNYGQVNGQPLGIYGRSLLINKDSKLVDKLLEIKLDDRFSNLRSDYPVINNLRADIDGDVGNISLYREDNSSEYQNAIIEQFQKLTAFNDEGYTDVQKAEIQKFFRDLMTLGFVQSGLNKSPISFSDLIPNEYYAPMMTEALTKFKALSPEQQKMEFIRFTGMFRGINTQLTGSPRNAIKYWRFKNYINSSSSKSEAYSSIADEPIILENGTYEALLANLQEDGLIKRKCN